MAAGRSLVATAVADERERVIARLSTAFAAGELDVEEFDRRVGLAQGASQTELDALTSDLAAEWVAPGAAEGAAQQTTQALAPAGARSRQSVVSIMGGAQRKGRWAVSRRVNVVSIMGGAVLDFREAQLPAGPVEVRVFALMGGVHIIVPPELAVEKDGFAIMGGFEDQSRAPAPLGPDAPRLRIRGAAIMGGVHIETRRLGESGGDARRRERSTRKALRAERRERRQLGD